MATGIQPDNTHFILTAGQVPYGFIAKTRTFWGATNYGAHGSASVTVQLDDMGNVLGGKVLVTGAIAAKNIADKSLLLEGDVVESVVVGGDAGQPIWISLLFRIIRSHANIGYDSPLGVWDAYIQPTATVPVPPISSIFQIEWGPAAAPLDSYIGQVRNLV